MISLFFNSRKKSGTGHHGHKPQAGLPAGGFTWCPGKAGACAGWVEGGREISVSQAGRIETISTQLMVLEHQLVGHGPAEVWTGLGICRDSRRGEAGPLTPSPSPSSAFPHLWNGECLLPGNIRYATSPVLALLISPYRRSTLYFLANWESTLDVL